MLDCWELAALYTISWLTLTMAGPHPQCVSSYWAVNMSARLSVCTKEELRSVIRFMWAEGVKGAEIHARLCTQYGDNALPRWSVYKWIEMVGQCNGCRTLGIAININNWWEAGRSQSHYSHWQKSDRRNRVTTGHQSRYGLFFSAWHSWAPQSCCEVGAQTSDRRA